MMILEKFTPLANIYHTPAMCQALEHHHSLSWSLCSSRGEMDKIYIHVLWENEARQGGGRVQEVRCCISKSGMVRGVSLGVCKSPFSHF